MTDEFIRSDTEGIIERVIQCEYDAPILFVVKPNGQVTMEEAIPARRRDIVEYSLSW